MPKTIHHTFGPHVDQSMLIRMLALSYQPWKYVRGAGPRKLKDALQAHLSAEPFLFASGRQSLLALLKALKIRPGEEVIVQGYTCIAVPNAIHAAGGVPVYADIDPNTLNLTMETVNEKLSERTRAVIVQHTFGIPGPARELKAHLKGKNIVLIEELVHSLPDQQGPDIGQEGDFVILSFGRDKAISGVAGGAVLSRDPNVSTLLASLEDSAEDASLWTVLRHLEYGPRMHSLVRPLAGTWVLKVFIKMLTVLRLIEPVLTREEKQGHMKMTLQKIPNACAELALFSLRSLPRSNAQRRLLTSLYLDAAAKHGWTCPQSIDASLPLQKFPIFLKNAEEIRQALMKKKIFLHDGWNTCVLCPLDCSLDAAGYAKGTDPEAEGVSEHILNLPTHPLTGVADARRLIEALKIMP